MNLLLHHFRKDIRHTRWMMLATFLFTAGALVFPNVPLEDRADQVKWLPLFRYGGWFLLFLTSGRLVQLDAPMRDTAFFRTLPVPMSTWLGSKLLTLLVLIIPMAMIECAMLLALGLNPGIVNLLLILGEEMLALSAIAMIAMAMAARKESVSTYHMSLIVWTTLGFVGLFIFVNFQNWLSRGVKTQWSYDNDIEYLKLSRLLLTRLVATVGIVIGMAWFVRNLRHVTLSILLLVTALCTAVAWFLWPVNFVKSFTAEQSSAPKNEWLDLSALKFSFQEEKAWSERASEWDLRS